MKLIAVHVVEYGASPVKRANPGQEFTVSDDLARRLIAMGAARRAPGGDASGRDPETRETKDKASVAFPPLELGTPSLSQAEPDPEDEAVPDGADGDEDDDILGKDPEEEQPKREKPAARRRRRGKADD